jgi:anti-anti-sigma factor
MATREAAARVHERDGDAVIELSGEVDRYAEQAVEGAYAEAAALGDGAIVLDFEHVDYINSTGIALIVGLLAKARAVNRQVRARGLTDHYREIFEITRLSDFMTIEGGTDG